MKSYSKGWTRIDPSVPVSSGTKTLCAYLPPPVHTFFDTPTFEWEIFSRLSGEVLSGIVTLTLPLNQSSTHLEPAEKTPRDSSEAVALNHAESELQNSDSELS